jgi:peptidoglycan/LPS O-acetylase OafA/YrhL
VRLGAPDGAADAPPEAREHATQPSDAAPRLDRFLAGDGLRLLAAVGVLVFHALVVASTTHPDATPDDSIDARIANLGRIGLWVFFVLSGYLLARPFVAAFVERRELPSVRNYMRNRLLRIVPALWLAAILTLIVFGRQGAGLGQIAAVFLFVQEADSSAFSRHMLHAWSVDVELAFYLLLPLAAAALFWIARRTRVPRAGLVWLLLAGVWLASLAFQRALESNTLLSDGWQRSPPAVFYAFVPGLVLALVEVQFGARLRGLRGARVLVTALLAGGLAIATVHTFQLPADSAWKPSITAALAAGAIVGSALMLQWTTGGAWRALTNRPIQWLGERSYGIYLFHLGAMLWIDDRIDVSHGARRAILIAGAFALATALAALSYRFVEQPFLRLRHGWRQPPAASHASRKGPASAWR